MSEITKDDEQNSNTPTYTGVKVVPVVDARGESILNRSRTETYEANDEKGMFEILKNSNFTHAEEEKKRDDANRLNAKKFRKPIKLF